MQHLSAFFPVQNPKLPVVDIVSLAPGKIILVSTFLLPVVNSQHLVQGSAVLAVTFDLLIHDFSVPAHCFPDLVHALRRLDDPRLEIRVAKKVPDVV